MSRTRFIFVQLLFLLVLCGVQASEGWRTFASYTDPDNKFRDEAYILDTDPVTYCVDWSNTAGWGSFLNLNLTTPCTSSLLRLSVDYGYGLTDNFQVDAFYQGDTDWTTVYTGPMANAAWQNITIPTGTVTKIRFRFHYTQSGWTFGAYGAEIWEDAQQVANPTPQTDAATSVADTTAVLHGTLSDDGGNPSCEMRFEYGITQGVPYAQSTAWSTGFSTGAKLPSPVSGLLNNTTYYFRAQARVNSTSAVVSGTELTFTTANIPSDGSVVWVRPTGTSDPDNVWLNESQAIDDSNATSSKFFQDINDPLGWRSFLYFTTNLDANGIRIVAHKDQFVDKIDIDIKQGCVWKDVYEGGFEDSIEEVYGFDRGQTTEVRVRQNIITKVGGYFHIYEVDLHHGTNTITITTPDTSQVSPAWVEGEFWANTQTIDLKVDGVSKSTQPVGRVGWFADAAASGPWGVPLSTTSTTLVEANAMDGATVIQTATQNITWTPTDLTGKDAATDSVSLRAGSSLLLTATNTGTTLTIDADNDGTVDFSGAPGDKFAFAYSTAGTYTSVARIDGVQVGSYTVHATTITLGTTAKAIFDLDNKKIFTITPTAASSDAFVQAEKTSHIEVTAQAPEGAGLAVNFKPLNLESSRLIARLGGATGPVMGFVDTELAELKFILRGYMMVVKGFANGDELFGNTLQMTPKLTGLKVRLYIFSGGAVFEDGATEQWVSSSDFDQNDQYNFYIVSSNQGKVGCHATDVTQDE